METLKSMRSFLQESWTEVRERVTWPSKEEVWGTTRVVLVATVIFGVIIAVMDVALLWVLNLIFDTVS